MKIIYLYILKELLTPFAFGVAAFTGIFIGTDLLFRLTDLYTRWGVSIFIIIKLFFLSLPAIIVLTFPMATLLATIMAYSRLSGDSEVTAFRAGGVSIKKLIIPALIVGLLMSVFTIIINEKVVPQANYIYDQLVWEIRYGEKRPESQYDLYITPLDNKSKRPDYILYTHKFDGESGDMTDVYLQEFNDGSPTALIEAEKARWLDNEWHFYQGKVYFLDPKERVPVLEFSEYLAREDIHQPDEINKLKKNIEDMNLKELREYIQLKEEQGRSTVEEWVKWHQHLSIPFANFIFALLAAPLGIQPKRSGGGSASGMGLSIILIFIYYILLTVGGALAGQGVISPFAGAWLQNIFFLIIGAFILHQSGK